jgi:hypothetical protein
MCLAEYRPDVEGDRIVSKKRMFSEQPVNGLHDKGEEEETVALSICVLPDAACLYFPDKGKPKPMKAVFTDLIQMCAQSREEILPAQVIFVFGYQLLK